MKKKYDIALVDLSNLYYRSYYRSISLGFKEKKLYQKTIELTLTSLNSLNKKFLWEWGTTYCLFDNPTSKISLRSEISKEYKAQRKKMPKMFYDYLNYLKTLLLSFNSSYKVVYVDLLEADDLVLPLIEKIDEKESIILISTDLDWSRSIGYKGRDIVWFNFKKVFDVDEFKIKFGFPPTVEKIILYKCLEGDPSDGISKVIKGLGKDTIKKLCNDYNSIEDVIIYANSIPYLSQTIKYRIQEQEEALKINKRLIEFIDIRRFGKIEDYIHNCSFKVNELKIFYSGLNISFPDWLKSKKEFHNESKYHLFKPDRLPRK